MSRVRTAILAGLGLLPLGSAGCFHTSGPMPASFYHQQPDSPRPIATSVTLLEAPPSGLQWYGCGTSEDSCTVVLQPALSGAIKSVLKNNFQKVANSPDLESAARDGDLVAMEDITTTPAYGVLDGYIRVTITFEDSRSNQILSEVTSVAKIHLKPVMWSPKHAALVAVDIVSLDAFLPVHGYIANQDGLAELTEAVQSPLDSSLQDLSHQIAGDAQLASFASAHGPPQVEKVEDRR